MAADPKTRKPTRAERLAAAAAARRRRQLQVRAAIMGGVVLVVAVAAFVFVSDRRDRNELVKRLESGGCDYDGESDSDQGPGLNHVAAPFYSVNPPAGGDHLAQAASAGRYTLENVPPDGQLVHSLEHGYIVLWHRPDADEATMQVLNDVADKYDRDVLIAPRPSLPTPVAATAWHDRLLCQAPDPAALELFVESFVNKGPEKVPH